MMWVDSHCHLDYPDYQADLPEALQRAADNGVTAMITIGTRLDLFPRVRAVAEAWPQIFCTVGVHPHEAGEHADLTADTLVELAAHPRVVGLGETGLDYFYEHSPRDAQQACFRAHIAAARRTGLPLVIHTRDADDDTAAILEEEMAQGPFTGLIHCFSSSQALADLAVRLGLYISASGIITFNKAENVRSVLETVPVESLLVETDAPYLAPVPKRGKRNEPAYVVHTAAKLAQMKGLPLDELARITTANVARLFPKMQLLAG